MIEIKPETTSEFKQYNFIHPELLTHPNIPKPLHGLNPRSILGNEWWDYQRKVTYAKNNYCCWACGVHKSIAKYHPWIEAHETYKYDFEKGEAKLIEIVALCHSCHNYIHDGRMQMMVQSGEMGEDKFLDIKRHGDKIIDMNDLFAQKYANSHPFKVADWNKWHIIIGNKSYYSKFKDFGEWKDFYANLPESR